MRVSHVSVLWFFFMAAVENVLSSCESNALLVYSPFEASGLFPVCLWCTGGHVPCQMYPGRIAGFQGHRRYCQRASQGGGAMSPPPTHTHAVWETLVVLQLRLYVILSVFFILGFLVSV